MGTRRDEVLALEFIGEGCQDDDARGRGWQAADKGAQCGRRVDEPGIQQHHPRLMFACQFKPLFEGMTCGDNPYSARRIEPGFESPAHIWM